jgi:molybdenum cofactor cytidylyltransferase
MGAFKPLLPFGDSTVIESCVANLRAAGVQDVIVVVGYRAENLRRQIKAPVTFAVNANPDSEMMVSIKLGLASVPSTARAILIAPVDHPAVSSSVIESLIENWRAGARLIQPEHDGRGGHPVLIDLAYRDELTTLDDQSGLRSLFTRHRQEVLRLPVESPFVAQDMDTWDDYVSLHQAVFGHKPKDLAASTDAND